MTNTPDQLDLEGGKAADDERWMVVAITTGADCIVLDYRNLGDFIDGICAEDSGLDVPNGTGPGVFAVRKCVVYGDPDEEERGPTTIEGTWVKLRDLSPSRALLSDLHDRLRASEAECERLKVERDNRAPFTAQAVCDLHADYSAAEARATTAEALATSQAEEIKALKADLTVIRNASQTSERIFGGSMSEVTRVFQNITRVAGMHLSRTPAGEARPDAGSDGGEGV